MSSVLDIIEQAAPAADALRLAKLPVDDLGMGERLRLRYGDLLAKTPDAGGIAYLPDEGVWRTGHKGEAQAKMLAHKVARALWDERAAAKEALKNVGGASQEPPLWEGQPDAILEAIARAGNASGTNAMLAQAAPYLTAELKDFDPDSKLICCLSGTLSPAFVRDPCFVVYDSDGVALGYVPAAGLKEIGASALLAGWRITFEGERTYAVIAPGQDEADAARVSDSTLKTGCLGPGGVKLAHRLYHLDLKLLPHHPGHRITRQTNVAWDPRAKAPQWRKHIETVLPDKVDRDFFHRFMGYCLLGSNEAQCFLFIQGKGADGKSTTMKVIARVLGSYFRSADPRTFLEMKQRSAADASPDMADLAGDTRGVYCEEPPRGARLNEALLKQITGGLELRARQLHKDLFDFEPRFSLTMAFNDLPRITGGDDGLWRRVRIVLFPHQFTLEEQLAAGNMVEKLSTEACGILNWLLEGLAAYHKFGLQPHERMKERVLEWRSTTDPFGQWLRERVEFVTGAKELTSALYADYQEYLEHEGVDGREVIGSRSFQNRLQSQQIESFRTNGGKHYRRGVRLRPRPDDWLSYGARASKAERGAENAGREER